VVQQAASGGRTGEIPHQYDHYPKEMLFDMFEFLRKRANLSWLKFSGEELKQFFVEEGETELTKD